MRKLINIVPEHIHDYGDCMSAILYKLFQYYNLPHFELLFTNDGHISYTQFDNPNVPYNTNEAFKMVHDNYFKTLEDTYNIRTLNIKCTKSNELIELIDNDTPVILNGRAIDMPWRPTNNIREIHSTLIVGYDTSNEVFICIDPIFESGLLELPFDNIQCHDERTSFLVIDPVHAIKKWNTISTIFQVILDQLTVKSILGIVI